MAEVPDLPMPASEGPASEGHAVTGCSLAFAAPCGSGLVGELRLPGARALSREEGLELMRAAAELRGFAAALEAVGAERVRAGFEAEMRSDPSDPAVAPGGGPARFGGDVARALTVAEVATAQAVSEHAASRIVALAESLAGPLRPVRDMLAAGALSEGHVRIIAQQAEGIDAEKVDEFVRLAIARLRTRAGRMRTVQEFRPVLVRLREKSEPESVTRRRQQATKERGVWFRPESDGMCTLTACVPAEVGLGLYSAVDTAARSHRTAFPDDPRNLAQLRADVLTHSTLSGSALPRAVPADFDPSLVHPDSLGSMAELPVGVPDLPKPMADRSDVDSAGSASLDSDSSDPDHVVLDHAPAVPSGIIPDCSDPEAAMGSGLRAQVVVLIPAATLLGASEEPATLDGYGPISPEVARRLAAMAPSWERLVTDLHGIPMMLGRSSYRPSAGLRKYVQWRDMTCVFPGCTSRASCADLDHTVEWADGGTTDAGNLAALCRKHHALKSLGHWTMEQVRDEGRGSGVLASLLAARDAADALDDRVVVAEGTGFITWTSPTGRTYTTAPAEYAHGPEDDLLADALSMPEDPSGASRGPHDRARSALEPIPEPLPLSWIDVDLLDPRLGEPIGPPGREAPEPPAWLVALWEQEDALIHALCAEGENPNVTPPPF